MPCKLLELSTAFAPKASSENENSEVLRGTIFKPAQLAEKRFVFFNR